MNKSYGFTLFEILIVLSLAAAITTVSIIGLSQLQAIIRLRNTGDEIRAMIQLGREYTLANKDSAVYSVSLASGTFKLLENSFELSRYQIPPGIIVDPVIISEEFTPVTGKLTNCSPCQINLSSMGNSEIIMIQENGIVN